LAIEKGNKSVVVVLTPYHQKKLALMCDRTGLSKTQVVQRLIEDNKIKELVSGEERK
jgi:hypothetical protein